MTHPAHRFLFLIQSGIVTSWAETLGTNIILTKKIPKNTDRLFFSNIICGFRHDLYQYSHLEGDYYAFD